MKEKLRDIIEEKSIDKVEKKITKKNKSFASWFFKGRIEKKIAEQKRIDELSKEYDEGKILEITKNKSFK